MNKIIYTPDLNKWSEFVYNHPYGNIYQTPEIARVYKKTKNYKPVNLAVINDNTNEILGILLGVLIKQKKGPFESFLTRSVIQGGPLFQDDSNGYNAATVLINEYDEITRRKGLYTEIRMLSAIPKFNSIISNCGYVYESHFNAIINIKKRSIEDLWKQIKRDKKRGIKKAEQIGIIIKECNDKNDIRLVYELIRKTYMDVRMPLPDISLFESTFDILVPKRRALFLLAKYKGKYIATQVALMDERTIYAWYTGSEKIYISHHPGDLLIWHLLKWGVENGYSIFDFGGGGTKQKNKNLKEYKQRFGTEFPEYGRYKKIYSPIKYNISMFGFNAYRRINNR